MDRLVIWLLEIVTCGAAVWGVTTHLWRRRAEHREFLENESDEDRDEREFQHSWSNPGEAVARSALILGVVTLVVSWSLQSFHHLEAAMLVRIGCPVAVMMGIWSRIYGPSRYSWPAVLLGLGGSIKPAFFLFLYVMLSGTSSR